MSGSNIIKGTLDLVILRLLAGGRLHGYGLAKAIRESSNDVLDIEEGVLYPALHRLEERGLLKARWGVSELNRRAKYYEVTPGGRRALSTATAEWESLSRAVTSILEGRGGVE